MNLSANAIRDLGEDIFLGSSSSNNSDQTNEASFLITTNDIVTRSQVQNDQDVTLLLDLARIRGFQKVPQETITFQVKESPDLPLRIQDIIIPAGNYSNVWNYIHVINQLCQEFIYLSKLGDVAGSKVLLKAARNVSYDIFDVQFSTPLWEKLGFWNEFNEFEFVRVSLLPPGTRCQEHEGHDHTMDNIIIADRSLAQPSRGGPNIVAGKSLPNLLANLGELEIVLNDVTNQRDIYNSKPKVLANFLLEEEFWNNITANQYVTLKAPTMVKKVHFQLRPDSVYEVLISDASGRPLKLQKEFKVFFFSLKILAES